MASLGGTVFLIAFYGIFFGIIIGYLWFIHSTGVTSNSTILFIFYYILMLVVIIFCASFIAAAITGVGRGNGNTSNISQKPKASINHDKYFLQKEQEKKDIVNRLGSINQMLICPHCQNKGSVRTKIVKKKKGISGAKATGAVLTLGLSMLATGLSRKEEETQAHCDKCNSTWYY